MNSKKKNDISYIKTDEQQFLRSYNIEDFERPSVATDMVVLSMIEEKSDCHRKDANPKLSVLLIKRGEHPFLNKWALPGGFVRADETIEQCAMREIYEETSLDARAFIPIGTFSDPDRDPRGRVITNVFATIVSDARDEIASGGDAIGAKWFSVSLEDNGANNYTLYLSDDDDEMSVKLIKKQTMFANCKFEIASQSELAFDHAKIIATALIELRRQAEEYDIAFNFLPEKFTLASFQRVQEILLGTTLLVANFRRKVQDLLLETDEYTEGIGHRPARLFKRK